MDNYLRRVMYHQLDTNDQFTVDLIRQDNVIMDYDIHKRWREKYHNVR